MAFRHAPRLESHRHDEVPPDDKSKSVFIPRSGGVWRDPSLETKLPGSGKASVGGKRIVHGDDLPKQRRRLSDSRVVGKAPEGGEKLAGELNQFLAKKRRGSRGVGSELN